MGPWYLTKSRLGSKYYAKKTVKREEPLLREPPARKLEGMFRSWNKVPFTKIFAKSDPQRSGRAVCNLVVRASDSRPECLGSIPSAIKYPPSTHGVRAREISGSESFMGCITSAGDWRMFPPLQSHGKIVEVEIVGVAIYGPFGEFLRGNSYCHLYDA
ncbi:hypothetical protein TNCV_4398901 [Trichonephila clavipes]|nr:hypothetical protein TNCV_4398901 [Trichonephila clavipes]